MNTTTNTLAGATVGWLSMWFFDPIQGRRRRALLRDRLIHNLRASQQEVDKASRDLRQALQGTSARMRTRIETATQRNQSVDDDRLLGRIRSKLGRYATHARSVEVSCRDGIVVLTGKILARDLEPLLAALRRVPGVERVDSRMDILQEATGVLKERPPPARPTSALFHNHWAPRVRVPAAALGGAVLLGGLLRSSGKGRDALGIISGIAGAALLVRAIRNRPFALLGGLSGEGGQTRLRKTITVQAPIGEVFARWADFESLPRVFSHVQEVQREGDSLQRWVIRGPLGAPLQSLVEVVCFEPNQRLAWRSVSGILKHRGEVRFAARGDDSTELQLELMYTPPLGVLMQSAAALFDSDPKHLIDRDLVAFKGLLERGITHAHHKRVSKTDLDAGIPTKN